MLFNVAFKIYIKFQFAMIIKYITHLIKCQGVRKNFHVFFRRQKTACKGRKETFMKRIINTTYKKKGYYADLQ